MTTRDERLRALARLVANDVHSNLCAYSSSEPRHSKACVDAAYVVALLDTEEESADADPITAAHNDVIDANPERASTTMRRLAANRDEWMEKADQLRRERDAAIKAIGEEGRLRGLAEQQRDELQAKLDGIAFNCPRCGAHDFGLLAGDNSKRIEAEKQRDEAAKLLHEAAAELNCTDEDLNTHWCAHCDSSVDRSGSLRAKISVLLATLDAEKEPGK